MIGSSPLARGLPADRVIGPLRGGIIPARAGFTTTAGAGAGSAGDHPRSRGVYAPPSARPCSGPGSSPLARGLPKRTATGPSRRRIIPARAGFTLVLGNGEGEGRDHPRSRGVYIGTFPYGANDKGSSPLARGLRRRDGHVFIPGGIIPARAGFTVVPSAGVVGGGDHPRSRGVYRLRARRPDRGEGSSPLARGLPIATTTLERAAEGSSPLARGLQVAEGTIPAALRIIPARAGFTRPSPTTPASTSDHPRSRGVYRDGAI